MAKNKNRKTDLHTFYCINCGNKGFDIPRDHGHQHKNMHRKKLYCIYCKEEWNHVECKDMWDVEEFKENFVNGVYKNEVEESLATCGTTWRREEHIYQAAFS